MAQPVLAFGCALVTGAGCVWYLPALALPVAVSVAVLLPATGLALAR